MSSYIARKQASMSSGSASLKGVDLTERMFAAPWGTRSTGNAVLTADTAYFIYCGRTAAAMTPKYVRAMLSSLASGAQVLQVGIFSTAAAPNGSAQTVTKIIATGTCDDVTTGVNQLKGNASAFSTSIPAGTYVWAAIYSNMATIQPGYHRIQEYGRGAALSTASSGLLTASSTFTAAPISTTATVPDLYITLD